jgi:hypothetical protein
MNPKPRSVRIGSRSVRFTHVALSGQEHHVAAIWDPAPPRRWKAGQLARYRAARDAFVAEVDEVLGCKPILIDKGDLAGLADLVPAGEILLAGRRAGVTCTAAGGEIQYHGDPDLVAVWAPRLRPHSAEIRVWLGAQRR